MEIISETNQKKRLQEYNINIITKYKDDNGITTGTNVTNGIILEKQYYRNKSLLKTIKGFDSRITYSQIKPMVNQSFVCPNCGYSTDNIENENECPYCGATYNIDYQNKKRSNKEHYDYVLNSNSYRKITYIIDLVISSILSYFYIYITSRTFNIYDICKIITLSILFSLLLFYIFYYVDAMVMLIPIKAYKENQNNKQKTFWEETNIDKNKFFNNIDYELKKDIFSKDNPNIIDYNIIDYLDFSKYQEDNNIYIKVKILIRFIKYDGEKIKAYIQKKDYIFQKTEFKDDNNKSIIVKCHNCNSNIDVTKKQCDYCGTKINYLQEWYLK